MKKVFSLLMATILLIISGCQNYDESLREDVVDLKNRVAALEMWAETVNSNITALQNIVEVLQNDYYVTGITSFSYPKPGGYVISFTNNGSITIFNGRDGQDGKDGADGVNGKDGKSPQISVQQDTDGVYYWTLNGEWITVDGNKLRVTGENGTDGKNPQIRVNSYTNIWEVSYDNGFTWSSLGVAATGADGQNGNTPLLRINDSNFWEVSYDNGTYWTSLGVAATGKDGADGNFPQLKVNISTNKWEISYDGGVTWYSLGIKATGSDGTNGKDGTNGTTPQLRINSWNIWEVTYDYGDTWYSLGVKATGDDGTNGTNGTNGQDGITPQLRVNSYTNIWEVSYDKGATWNSLGVKATGNDGADGADGADGTNGTNGTNGITPQLRINWNIWEVSYDGGVTWTSLGVKATGDNGADGQDGTDGQDGADGVTPKIRINYETEEWEISYDNGNSWTGTGMIATGDKGEQGAQGEKGDSGDAIFANNGVDNSNSDYVEFTLADGVTKIKIPKYKTLGLDFVQPGEFTEGETKEISYTTVGKVVIVKIMDIPNGWKATVNTSAKKFMVTAPAIFDDSNRGGEAIILVSDNDQHTIMRTINFSDSIRSDDNGGSGSEPGDGDGDEDEDEDDGGDDDGGGSGGEDDGGDAGADATAITIEGYLGNTMTVYYTDDTYNNITKNSDGIFAVSKSNKIIHNIALEGGTTIIVGRKADGSAIPLRLNEGNLALRDAVNGYIPIGTYSEFQLINANATTRTGKYKQEADLDLLDLEWTPIGKYGSDISLTFKGLFDGDNHTIANLKITGNNDNVGLFGYIYRSSDTATIQNVNIISGAVSGGSKVGSVCGASASAYSSIINCSNASSVSGSGNYVGGVCGDASYSIITDCSNTGSVMGVGYIGGVCGHSSYSTITDCSNTNSVIGTGNYVGGVCGYFYDYSSDYYYSITGCSNIGSISGSSSVGGICGYFGDHSSTIIACSNTGSVSGSSNVGGICGYFNSSSSYSPYSSSSITACFNTGSVIVTGDYVGGVCGYASAGNRSSISITACYNTNSVSGNFQIGGVCGYAYNSVSITACYNTGSVSGSSGIGGVCGSYSYSSPYYFSITACYWKNVSGDNADYGIGSSASNTNAVIFSIVAWPTIATDTQWGTGDGSGSGKYWKSLGGWNGGNPVYPKLYYED
jgi:hypothetical protein